MKIQESVGKDIERAFGGAFFYFVIEDALEFGDFKCVVDCAVILHNMIFECDLQISGENDFSRSTK